MLPEERRALDVGGRGDSLIGMPRSTICRAADGRARPHVAPAHVLVVGEVLVLMIGPQGTSSGLRIAMNSRLV